MEFEIPENVIYIDEFKRDRWLTNLRQARLLEKLVKPSPEQQFGRNIIPFPDGDGVA